MSSPLTPEREAEIVRMAEGLIPVGLHNLCVIYTDANDCVTGEEMQSALGDLHAEVRRLRAENEKIYASNKFLEQRCARLEADRHPSMSPRKNTEP